MRKTDKQVLLLRDHSHANIIYRLYRDLSDEKKDKIYTAKERRKIEAVIHLLQEKEQKLKNKHTTEEWYKLGDYTIWR